MFGATWPKISQRGGVEDDSERKEMAVEEEWSCKKTWGADRAGERAETERRKEMEIKW